MKTINVTKCLLTAIAGTVALVVLIKSVDLKTDDSKSGHAVWSSLSTQQTLELRQVGIRFDGWKIVDLKGRELSPLKVKKLVTVTKE